MELSPKEKADEILNKYLSIDITMKGCEEESNPCIIYNNMLTDGAKRCAIVHVKGIIDVLGGVGVYAYADPKVEEYYEEVLTELEKNVKL